MKVIKNPCYECVCVPMCASRDVVEKVTGCTILTSLFWEIYNKHGTETKLRNFTDVLSSKKFFDIKYLETL